MNIMNEKQRKIIPWLWVLLPVYCVIGFFFPVIGSVALICMLAPVIMAVYKGRKWCGSFCPRGNLNDVILPRISLGKKIPVLMKKGWFRAGFLVLLMSAFTIQIVLVWGDPGRVGMVFVRMVFVTTLLAIIFGVFYKPRTWCTVCPMGTLAGWVSKANQVTRNHALVTFAKEKCIDCGICSKSCLIGIDVHHYKKDAKVLDGDCLKCNACVAKCPKKALKIA